MCKIEGANCSDESDDSEISIDCENVTQECQSEISADGVCGKSDKKKSQSDAEKACKEKGGSLMSPKNQDDIDFLRDIGEDLWVGIEYDGDNWIYTDSMEARYSNRKHKNFENPSWYDFTLYGRFVFIRSLSIVILFFVTFWRRGFDRLIIL